MAERHNAGGSAPPRQARERNYASVAELVAARVAAAKGRISASRRWHPDPYQCPSSAAGECDLRTTARNTAPRTARQDVTSSASHGQEARGGRGVLVLAICWSMSSWMMSRRVRASAATSGVPDDGELVVLIALPRFGPVGASGDHV